MSAAQAWFIFGGLLNLLIGVLAAYALFWVRASNPARRANRYALVTHHLTMLNGVLLLSLSLAIDHTNFTPEISTGLAIAALVGTLLSDGRNILRWAQGLEDEFSQGVEWQWRLIGLGNMIPLLVVSAILYGFARTALGLW